MNHISHAIWDVHPGVRKVAKEAAADVVSDKALRPRPALGQQVCHQLRQALHLQRGLGDVFELRTHHYRQVGGPEVPAAMATAQGPCSPCTLLWAQEQLAPACAAQASKAGTFGLHCTLLLHMQAKLASSALPTQPSWELQGTARQRFVHASCEQKVNAGLINVGSLLGAAQAWPSSGGRKDGRIRGSRPLFEACSERLQTD